MLLIMIFIKESVPSIVTTTLKPYVSYLQLPDNSPKERELLLRLFLSSLPSSSVLSELSTSTTISGETIIHNLHYLPTDFLLENYISREDGLLDIENTDYLQAVIQLLIRISQKSPLRYCTQILQQMLARVSRKEIEQITILLQGITSILKESYYILTFHEMKELTEMYGSNPSIR